MVGLVAEYIKRCGKKRFSAVCLLGRLDVFVDGGLRKMRKTSVSIYRLWTARGAECRRLRIADHRRELLVVGGGLNCGEFRFVPSVNR